MDTPKPELSFEESMKQVMKTLPPVIRDYLVQEKYTPVARSLMTKYGLRIDQGGVLEREIMLLLMGVENPTEFTETLAEEAKLTKIVIDGIVQDVNNLIFVPLRKEEEKGGTTATEVRPSPEIPKVEPQIQPAAPKAEPEPATHFKLENKIPMSLPATPAPKKDWSPPVDGLPPAPMRETLPPKVFLPRPSTLGDVVRSVLAAPRPTDTSKLLEDHEEPHIELNKADVPVNLPGVLPPVAPEIQSSPILKVEPRIQPVIPIPVEVAPELLKVEPRIQPVAPTAPVAPKPIVVTPITSYSSDPYREPVDEPIDEM